MLLSPCKGTLPAAWQLTQRAWSKTVEAARNALRELSSSGV
jgi:uncharacterized protein YukE